jgi:hypothetical protein
MRPGLVATAALLCALPASGDAIQPTPEQVAVLSTIDSAPARAQIDLAFGPDSETGVLAIARGPTASVGLQIRAIRVLPQYCLPSCAGTPTHQALADLVIGYRAQMASAALSAQDLLRLRAAIEALGATRSGLPADVDLLTDPALMRHPSRDVQVTTVHALRRACSPDLCPHDACVEGANAVRALRSGSDTQLDAAVNIALQDLAPCSQP